MFTLSRRHRFTTIALAAIAAGIFLIFITRVYLQLAVDEPRSCTTSALYNGLTQEEREQLFHGVLNDLVEERMRLYQGADGSILHCSKESMAEVIPSGVFAAQVAAAYPLLPTGTNFTYAHFEELLYEHWRTYDCHLFALKHTLQADPLQRERAQRAFFSLLTVLRSSEHYLPLHASLRCLQRAGVDVRNAMALVSDASMCAPIRLSQPETSLLQ